MIKKVTILGHGYVSEFLIQKFDSLGWPVYCTSRKVDPEKPATHGNVTIIHFLDARLSSIIKSSNIILSTVPPGNEVVDPVLQIYGNVLAKGQFEWIGYLSSTSVYGNHHGSWVDEETECSPGNEKSKRRLLAEKQWLDLYFNCKLPIHILRLSGIYGPGRNCLEDILTGKNFTIKKENQYFSRIHIEDIVKAITASIEQPTPGEIYNISDEEPSQIHIVQQFGAKILGKEKLKEMPIEDAILSEQAELFFQDNKKVSSNKIVQKLNIHWQYPNYRLGLLKGCLPYLP